jgi:hypothetical protein
MLGEEVGWRHLSLVQQTEVHQLLGRRMFRRGGRILLPGQTGRRFLYVRGDYRDFMSFQREKCHSDLQKN